MNLYILENKLNINNITLVLPFTETVLNRLILSKGELLNTFGFLQPLSAKFK